MSVVLPDVYAQVSLYEVLKDIGKGKVKSEEVWVEFGAKEVRFTADARGFSSATDGYRASVSDAAKALELHSPERGLTLVRFGDRITDLKEHQRVTCGAVSGSKLLLGNDRGNLTCVDTNNPELTSELEGHLLHTSVAQFFPSGEVALSAGMDYAIKLWDVATGAQVQKLQHQRGLVEDVAMIARGRNLLSLCPAADPRANVALWEVGTPQLVHEYFLPTARAISIWDRGSTTDVDTAPLYNIGGNVALVGTQSSVQALDVRQARPAETFVQGGASALTVSGDRLVYADEKNAIGVDLRMPGQRLFTLSSPTTVTQLVSTASKAYVRTAAGIYGYAFQSQNVETLCADNKAVLAVYRNELFTLGSEARHFPL